MTIYGHIWLKSICQHDGDLQGHKLVKKNCQKFRFWSLNLNYPIWYLNIKPRHLQWLSMVTYNWNWWCQHAFWSFLRFMVISCVIIGQKYAKNVNLAPLDPEYPIWYLNIVSGDFLLLPMVIYDWNWYVSVQFDLFRSLWRSSGEKIDQKYAINAYFVIPWIPNIQYDATILCQEILYYYLWSYSDRHWYASMHFDLFQDLWRSPGLQIC